MGGIIPNKIIDYNSKLSLRYKEAIKRKFSYFPKSSELYIFFPGNDGKIYMNYFIRRTVLNGGFSFLEYEFPEGELSSDAFLTLKFFGEVEKLIKKDIKTIIKRYNLRNINLIGVSLGCIDACIAAKSLQRINRIFLVAPIFDLSKTVWESKITRDLKNKMISAGMTYKKLKIIWKSLSILELIKYIKFKEVNAIASKTDKVCLYKNDYSLIFKNKKIEIIKNKSVGHYFCIFYFYFFPRRLLKIFKKQYKLNH
jgi:hypothetical protein